MLKSWLIKAAIAFALRQLAKWKDGINWETVKADLEARIRDLVPGELFDDEAAKMVRSVVDMIAGLLGDQAAITNIIALVIAGKMAEAMEALKDLIINRFKFTGAEPDQFVDDVLACLA
jgi:hypothetical protein